MTFRDISTRTVIVDESSKMTANANSNSLGEKSGAARN